MSPEAFVINLDRNPDRLAAFAKRNAGVDVVKFTAVDGTTVDRPEMVRKGLISADLEYGAGTLGCALSHTKLWTRAATENRPLTIFEDDVAISHAFGKQSAAMFSSLRDWDFIFWGCALALNTYAWIELPGFGLAKFERAGERITAEEEIASYQGDSTARALFRLRHCWGLIAYSISPRGARMALDHCVPIRKRPPIAFSTTGMSWVDRGIDGPANEIYPRANSYLCLPPLAIHVAQFSERRRLDDLSL